MGRFLGSKMIIGSSIYFLTMFTGSLSEKLLGLLFVSILSCFVGSTKGKGRPEKFDSRYLA